MKDEEIQFEETLGRVEVTRGEGRGEGVDVDTSISRR